MSSPEPVTAEAVGATDDERIFARFTTEVARAQLDAWLPPSPSQVLDLSNRSAPVLDLLVRRGNRVLHADPAAEAPSCSACGPGRLLTVQGDPRNLGWLADEAVDVVVAEGGTLSEALAAEVTVDDLHRVLRPRGRLLICVESLVNGLSRLADQGCWAELADVPAADVVLVPSPDGSVSRCFWPEELHAILADAGFEVDWVRPRTVLAEQTVVRALRGDPAQLPSLVATELALEQRRQGESIGGHLVASATRG